MPNADTRRGYVEGKNMAGKKYSIALAWSKGHYISVHNGKAKNKAKAEVSDKPHAWKLHLVGKKHDVFTIEYEDSGFFLNLKNNSEEEGTMVWLHEDSLFWKLEAGEEDNQFYVRHNASTLYLTAKKGKSKNGTKFQLHPEKQSFNFIEI